jgi:hypothetical protein
LNREGRKEREEGGFQSFAAFAVLFAFDSISANPELMIATSNRQGVEND